MNFWTMYVFSVNSVNFPSSIFNFANFLWWPSQFEWIKSVCSAQVHDQLRQELSSDKSTWTFLEKPVCLKAWKSLVGIGPLSFVPNEFCFGFPPGFFVAFIPLHVSGAFSNLDSCCWGSGRFNRLKESAANGDLSPPVDLRYLTKPSSKRILDVEWYSPPTNHQ